MVSAKATRFRSIRALIAAAGNNAELLRERGLIKATPFPYDGGEIIIIDRLTRKGHDLLETLRSRPVWEKIKSIATEKGIELSFDAVKKLGPTAIDLLLKARGLG